VRTLLITSLVALSVLTPSTAQAAACSWEVSDLPLPAGTSLSMITGAADDGSWVVGLGTVSEPRWEDRAIFWHNGEVTSVSLGVGGTPYDVDPAGTFVHANTDGRAFRGSMQLNPLPGANWAWASSINSNGTAAGRSGRSVVIWPGNSQDPREIPGTDVDGIWSVAGIDDEGRVAASLYGENGQPVPAYVWDENGNRATVQPLPGHTKTIVNDIRNGRIVGYSAHDGWTDRVGVEWDVQGNIVRVLNGAAEAIAVSFSGDIFGRAPDAHGPGGPAAIWRHNGEVDQPPAGYIYEEFTDTGNLYGRAWRNGSYDPIVASCL